MMAGNQYQQQLFHYNGHQFTLPQWATKLGLPYNTFAQRVHRYGIDRAIAMGTKRLRGSTQTPKRFTYNGETLSIREWAKRIGITPETLRQRINTHGIERALTMKGYVKNTRFRWHPGIALACERQQ